MPLPLVLLTILQETKDIPPRLHSQWLLGGAQQVWSAFHLSLPLLTRMGQGARDPDPLLWFPRLCITGYQDP